MIPALGEAALDRGLHDSDVRVLVVFVFGGLDVQQFRPVKQAYVAGRLKIGRSTVAHALRRLAARGYLECGPEPRSRSVVRTYRLCYSQHTNTARPFPDGARSP